jgi:hypothetical protein
MGFLSVVGSFISTVSSSVSSIGNALSSFATNVGPVIAGIINALAPVAEALGKFANAFLQGMGILKPNEKIEDMGEKALQAADQGITMDKFEKFDDYMNALRDFNLDPEISAKRNPAEKLIAGLGVGTVGAENKFNLERGSLNGMWLLPMANPAYFTPERMQSLLSSCKLGSTVFDYLEKRLSGSEARSFEKKLEVTTDGWPMKDSEMDKLYGALDSARKSWADINQQTQAQNNAGNGM